MRAPSNFTIEQIATTDLVELNYTVPASTVTSATLVLTNTTNSILAIDVYINNTVADFLFCRVDIPAGVGKKSRVMALYDEKLNTGFTIKLQATTASAFNAFLSGSEVSDS